MSDKKPKELEPKSLSAAELTRTKSESFDVPKRRIPRGEPRQQRISNVSDVQGNGSKTSIDPVKGDSLDSFPSTISSDGSISTNWSALAQKLQDMREMDINIRQAEQMKILRERKPRSGSQHTKMRIFWRRFSCLFLGTMFFRHRHRFLTLLEVLFPIVLSFLIFAAFTSGVSFRKAYTERQDAEDAGRNSTQLKFDDLVAADILKVFRSQFTDKLGRAYVAFAPTNPLTVELIQRMLNILGVDNQNKVIDTERHSSFGAVGVDSYLEVMEHSLLHRKDKVTHKSPVGINFTFSSQNSSYTDLPLKMAFSISTFAPSIGATSQDHPYVMPPRSEDWQTPYIATGFLGIQYALEKAFIDIVYERTNTKYLEHLDALDKAGDIAGKLEAQKLKPKDPEDFPQLILKLVYTPNFYDGTIRNLIAVVMSSTITISYMFLSYFIVRQLVIETQSGIKDLLTMHTLPKYYHWIVLYCHSVLLRTITSLGITTSLFIDYGGGSILRQSDVSVILLIMLFHLFSLSSFNFFISTVFTSVDFCGIYSVCLCFLSFFIPYCLFQANLISFLPNVILCVLFPNWALCNILYDVVDFECDDSGANWNNIQSRKSGDRISIAVLMLIFLCNSGAYFFLAVARDLLFTRENSGGYTWYRLIQKCCVNRREAHRPKVKSPKKLKVSSDDEAEEDDSDYEKPAIYEKHELPSDSAVKVRHLSKMYGKHRLVLDNISMDFAHGEITVLLGHTDSGKSTMIECIAGLVQPSTGTISVNGYDVGTDTKRAMSFMGLCPQDVRSFNLFTVKEHLTLCYQLRGLSHKDSQRQTTSLMSLLRLTDVSDRVPAHLTDDEKRKLGIAMCLVDKPVVILLDEPTLRMEPLARHEIWNILKHLKQDGHSIILTTNMMDEAEYLADRVVLLSHGKLICCGTPGFLKEQYDTGYYLKIVPNPVKFNLSNFQRLALKYFDETLRDAPKKTILDQRNFILVLPKQYQKRYSDFFDEIDEHKHKLGIIEYGVQSITLSDVFVKICETVSSEKDAPDLYARKNSKDQWITTLSSQVPVIPKDEKVAPKFSNQFPALFQKRYHCFTFKYFLQIVWEIIVPTVFIWVVVWHAHIFVLPIPMPVAREFTLDSFPKLKAYYRLSGGYTDEVAMGWGTHVKKVLGSHGEKLAAKDHVLKTIYRNIAEDQQNKDFNLEKRMIALEIRTAYGAVHEQLVLYFSSGSLHSPPLIFNTVANIMLRAITYKTAKPETYSISTSNIPFPTHIETPFDLFCDVTCVIFALIVSCCIGFFGSIFLFPRSERLTGMKQLQIMSGVPPFTYWLTHYVFDVMLSIFLTAIVIVTFVLDTYRTFWSFKGLVVLGLFLLLFLCWSSPPWIYYLTTVVTTKLTGTGFITFFHIVFATIPFLVLEWTYQDSPSTYVQGFRVFFHCFPPYTLTAAFRVWFDIVAKRSSCLSIPDDILRMCKLNNDHMKMYNTQAEMREIFRYVVKHDTNLSMCCEKICSPSNSCFVPPSFFDAGTEHLRHPRLAFCIVALILQGIVLWAFLILTEKRIVSRAIQTVVFKLIKHHVDKTKINKKELPKDIFREYERVLALVKNHREKKQLPARTALVCSDLTKSYTTRMVLNSITMEVKKGEIIGVLGGGGSGKSTLIQIMAGEVVPTRGSIFIGNFSIREHRTQYLEHIGYCPQTNSMFDNFTGIEMMRLMGKLKGVPASLLEIHVKKWLQVLGLTELGKDLCRNYSRSMKRLLCGAMALIGGNPVLLFDEPTTGIDPLARQRFWSVIKYMATQGHSIIFSSYNVDECAMVCSRVMVLSEGNPQCIGTPEDLRTRFSRGFSLLIRIRFEVLTPMEIVSATIGRIFDLKKTVEKKFKHATLRDEQDNLLLYFLRDTKLTWGEVFRVAEEIKTLHLEVFDKYFVSQASLEDVFILLTNRYREMDTPRRMESSYPGEISQFEAETKALEAAKKKGVQLDEAAT